MAQSCNVSRLAEIAEQYLKKGSKVFVEGKLKQESGKTKKAKIDTQLK